MDILAIDHSRSLLYTLNLRRSISVYSIPNAPDRGPPQLITTLKDIHRTASLISPNNASLLRREDFAIVSLQPIRSQESRTVSLLATTSNGVRLYFTHQRSGYRAFTSSTSSSAGTASTLELLYVRAPPASGLNPTPVPPTSASLSNQGDYPTTQPPMQNVAHAIYRDGLFLAAGAYAFEGGFDNVLCLNRSTNTSTILSNTTVSAGSTGSALTPAIPAASASTLADPAEQATDVLVQGATWALAEVPRHAQAGNESLNPLVRQKTSLPRTFLVLTSTGLTVLVETRPIDLLRDLLERTSVAAGSASAESVGLVELFKRHGQAQSCAMALAIATRNSHVPLSLDALLSVNPSTSSAFPAQMFTAESLLHATRVYFDFGGLPRYESPPYPHQPLSEGRVVLSGRHDGFGVYLGRLVGSIWQKDLKAVGGAGVGAGSPASTIGRDLTELRAFVSAHVEAFGVATRRNGGGGGGSASDSRGSGPRNGGIVDHAAPPAASEGEAMAQRTELESLRALTSVLERSIEALSFIVLVGDFGWERVLAKVSADIKTKVEGMKFGDLVLEEGEQPSTDTNSNPATTTASRALVEALIDLHSTSSPSGMDVIADLLQSRCPSFCNANDVRLYKALERIRQAKEAPAGSGQREELLRESEVLMSKTGARLPFERLAEVTRLWKDMDWVGAALQLPLRCASEWDPRGFAQSYRQDGMPAGDVERRTAYEGAMKCYGLVLETLRDLDERVEKAGGGSGNHARVESLRSVAYSIARQSPDPLLHEALYDFLLASGRREQLLELRTPFLEAYLQQEPLTLEKLEMLWQCYTRRGEGASAARVLVGLAESSELDLTLFQRLEYLTLASTNAKSASGSVTSAASASVSVAFVAEIEEKLEVAQVQVEVYRAVGELEDVEEDKRAVLQDELDAGLLDISTLYQDFAEPLELFDVKILIFHVADFRDQDLVASTWEAILDRAHAEGTRLLSAERAYERVSSVVIELGRRFMHSESACPIDVLVRNLEAYALTQRSPIQAIPEGWAPTTLLQATAPHEAVFDTLGALYQSKMEPWQTKGNIVFLLRDIQILLEAWMDAQTSRLHHHHSSQQQLSASASASQQEPFPANRVDDALNAYLVTLHSFVGGQLREERDLQLARSVINGFKVLQDGIRSMW